MSDASLTKRSEGAPDWVDILLADTVTAWGTVVGVSSLVLLVGYAPIFRLEMIPVILGMLLATAGIGFFLALYVCVFLGLPALGLAKLLKLNHWWQAAIIGALAGLLVVLVFPMPDPSQGQVGVILTRLLFVVAGALAGMAAWRERRKGLT